MVQSSGILNTTTVRDLNSANTQTIKKKTEKKNDYIKMVNEPISEKKDIDLKEKHIQLESQKRELEEQLNSYKKELMSEDSYKKACTKVGVNAGAIAGTIGALAILTICTGGLGGVGLLPILGTSASGFIAGAGLGYGVGNLASKSESGLNNHKITLQEKISKLEAEIAKINSEIQSLQ